MFILGGEIVLALLSITYVLNNKKKKTINQES